MPPTAAVYSPDCRCVHDQVRQPRLKAVSIPHISPTLLQRHLNGILLYYYLLMLVHDRPICAWTLFICTNIIDCHFILFLAGWENSSNVILMLLRYFLQLIVRQFSQYLKAFCLVWCAESFVLMLFLTNAWYVLFHFSVSYDMRIEINIKILRKILICKHRYHWFLSIGRQVSYLDWLHVAAQEAQSRNWLH